MLCFSTRFQSVNTPTPIYFKHRNAFVLFPVYLFGIHKTIMTSVTFTSTIAVTRTIFRKTNSMFNWSILCLANHSMLCQLLSILLKKHLSTNELIDIRNIDRSTSF